MNPLTNVKNLQKLNQHELELGLTNKKSWHDKYKDSAWIFVGGLPYDLTEGDVVCVFSQYGEVVNINLVRDQKTGKSKGFCFICFEDQRSTVLSVDNLNGIKLLGRTLRVDHVEEYRKPKEHGDEDQMTLKIRSEGIAPREAEPVTITAPEPDVRVKKKEKTEKIKKRKHKEEKRTKRDRKEKSEPESLCDSDSDSNIKRVKVKKEKHDSGYDAAVTTDKTYRDEYSRDSDRRRQRSICPVGTYSSLSTSRQWESNKHRADRDETHKDRHNDRSWDNGRQDRDKTWDNRRQDRYNTETDYRQRERADRSSDLRAEKESRNWTRDYETAYRQNERSDFSSNYGSQTDSWDYKSDFEYRHEDTVNRNRDFRRNKGSEKYSDRNYDRNNRYREMR